MNLAVGLRKMIGLEPKEEIKLNDLIQRLTRRTERMDPAQQARTFVSLGGLEHSLLNAENRIIFGRRGTGKTHIISFVAQTARKKRELALQIDLRAVGSNSYIYADQNIPLAERATRLLRDFINAIHDRLLEEITAPGTRHNMQQLAPAIDRIGAAVKEVLVRDSIEVTRSSNGASEGLVEAGGEAKLAAIGASASLNSKASVKSTAGASQQLVEKSHARLSVNIGGVSKSLIEFASIFKGRVWVLLDEWSSLPEELQPYLADFVRRCLFPISNYTVHIAAIERRSAFRIGHGSSSIGIELGSDASADINLDDYLVFENNPTRSMIFFQEMLFRHLLSVGDDAKLPFTRSEQFVSAVFTQGPTMRELVRACEGVPRDAINILQLAATHAQEERISIPHIRAAAKDWYDRDKAAYLLSDPKAESLLQWIVNIVVGNRKVKAFLVATNAKSPYLERLFDERILHIAKRSYSAKHDPSKRYRIWKIDYGCYVDKVNTSQGPTGFLFDQQEVRDAAFTVPEDDFRKIRHAVLDLTEYEFMGDLLNGEDDEALNVLDGSAACMDK